MKKYKGLSDSEVEKNQRLYGLNILNNNKKNKFLYDILSVLKQPMIILLMLCVLIYIFIGEKLDSIILLFSIVIIIFIEIRQSIKTDKALELLKKLACTKSRVIRNGEICEIDSSLVTVDDLLVLSEGDKVVADTIILESTDLYVDESSLTGESVSVSKSIDLIDKDSKFKSNYVYSGSLVTRGNAICKVINIGTKTFYGKIAKDLSSIKKLKSPLQNQINKLIKIFSIIALICFICVTIIVGINEHSFIDGILSGLTIAIGVIPEEFQVVLTVFLSLGAYRLAKNNAVVRNLASVETLGSITYLCVDKTGTITKNMMEINELVTDMDKTEFIKHALLATEETSHDSMDNALKNYSKIININNIYDNKELIKSYPFSNDTKMTAKIYNIDNRNYIYVKGALESLFDICDLNVEEKYNLYKCQKEMAKRGLRVIAIGSKNIRVIKDDIFDYRINFDGLIGFYDPPKDGIKDAVKLCQNAGIKIIMMTGDNMDTASSIGKTIGLKNYNNIINGKDLDKMSDEELVNCIKDTAIFSRVVPTDKLRIVEALQEHGEVVAMTGDGVNDAPALKKANIGISMGKRGTDVAKEASDLILLDDNFSTIVNTIKDARRIYNNIKKSITYIFIVHIPIILLALIVPLFKLPLLLLPIHIVILELVIDPTCSIIFERQKANNTIIKILPRKQNENLINTKTVLNSILRGLIIFTFVFVSYIIMIDDRSKANSFAFGMLLMSNIFLTYSILFKDSDLKSIKQIIKDKVVLIINILVFFILIGFIYLPFMNDVFNNGPINIGLFILMIFLSFVSVFWINIGGKRK